MDIQVPELVNEIRKRWGFSDNQIGWLIGTSQQNIANWRRGIHKKYSPEAAMKLYEILEGRLSFECDPICLANFMRSRIKNPAAYNQFYPQALAVLANSATDSEGK